MFTNRFTSSVAVLSHMYVTKEAALSRDTMGATLQHATESLLRQWKNPESRVSHADSNNIRFDYVFLE